MNTKDLIDRLRAWARRYEPRSPERVLFLESAETLEQTEQRIAAAVAEATAGGAHQNAVLSEADVVAMRERRQAGASWVGIADEFGISRRQAKRIVTGEHWAHVPGAVSDTPPTPSES
jgi:hypothetical protein